MSHAAHPIASPVSIPEPDLLDGVELISAPRDLLPRWQAVHRCERPISPLASGGADVAFTIDGLGGELSSWLTESGPSLALTISISWRPRLGHLSLGLQLSALGFDPMIAARERALAVTDLDTLLDLRNCGMGWSPCWGQPRQWPVGSVLQTIPSPPWMTRQPDELELIGAHEHDERIGDLLRLLARQTAPTCVSLTLCPVATNPEMVRRTLQVEAELLSAGTRPVSDHLGASARALAAIVREDLEPSVQLRVALFSEAPLRPLLRSACRRMLGLSTAIQRPWVSLDQAGRRSFAQGGHSALNPQLAHPQGIPVTDVNVGAGEAAKLLSMTGLSVRPAAANPAASELTELFRLSARRVV